MILIFFTRDHFGDNIIFNGVYNYSMDKETGHKLRALFRFKKQTIRCWNNELAMNPCQCPVIEIIYQQSGEMFVRVSTFNKIKRTTKSPESYRGFDMKNKCE